MRKPEFSNEQRKLIIELAHTSGMSDGQIFRKAVTGVLGAANRKRIIIQWGELMGLEPSEALRIAQRDGVVLTKRLPSAAEPET